MTSAENSQLSICKTIEVTQTNDKDFVIKEIKLAMSEKFSY